MKAFAFDVWNYLPKNYFKYSHAAMMRVEYPFNVYAAGVTALASVIEDFQPVLTSVTNNTIADNLNMQVVTYKALRY